MKFLFCFVVGVVVHVFCPRTLQNTPEHSQNTPRTLNLSNKNPTRTQQESSKNSTRTQQEPDKNPTRTQQEPNKNPTRTRQLRSKAVKQPCSGTVMTANIPTVTSRCISKHVAAVSKLFCLRLSKLPLCRRLGPAVTRGLLRMMPFRSAVPVPRVETLHPRATAWRASGTAPPLTRLQRNGLSTPICLCALTLTNLSVYRAFASPGASIS